MFAVFLGPNPAAPPRNAAVHKTLNGGSVSLWAESTRFHLLALCKKYAPYFSRLLMIGGRGAGTTTCTAS